MRLINDSDEAIVLEPGESMDFRVESEIIRTTASRLRKIRIKSRLHQ